MISTPSEYMVRRRARFESPTGSVNLPYGTRVQVKLIPISEDGKLERYLFYRDNLIASELSDIVKRYLVSVDGNEVVRGKLIDKLFELLKCDPTAIQNVRTLENQRRWSIVWKNPIFQQYRNMKQEDFWIWNLSLFQANQSALEQLVQLIQ